MGGGGCRGRVDQRYDEQRVDEERAYDVALFWMSAFDPMCVVKNVSLPQ